MPGTVEVKYHQKQKKTPTVGLEPTTTWLRAKRSTDWARRAALESTLLF